MKKGFVLSYVSIATVFVLCIISLVQCNWFGLFCNVMWLFIAYMVLLTGKRISAIRRENHFASLLNSKLIDIIAELAAEDGKVDTVFDKINRAREEACKESKQEE